MMKAMSRPNRNSRQVQSGLVWAVVIGSGTDVGDGVTVGSAVGDGVIEGSTVGDGVVDSFTTTRPMEYDAGSPFEV
jgi:hypothetical protein